MELSQAEDGITVQHVRPSLVHVPPGNDIAHCTRDGSVVKSVSQSVSQLCGGISNLLSAMYLKVFFGSGAEVGVALSAVCV